MMMHRSFLSLLCLFLCGCSLGPVCEKPEMDIPTEWHTEVSHTSNKDPIDCFIWWEHLQDPMLNQLMTIAEEQNLDLKIAAMRVLQARAQAFGKKGDLYPHVDGSVNYGHIYYSKEALVDGLLGTCGKKCNHVRRNVNFYELGFDACWEIDLFGMTRHEIAALQAHEEAVQESLCAVWVTLSAEIAKNYIELRTFQKRLEILLKQIGLQERSVALTKELYERGLLNDVDLGKTEAELSSLKAVQPQIEQNMHRTINRISVLLGYNPGEIAECLQEASSLPHLPECQPIGMPSELLRRRPDILKAEKELEAATERVQSAIAALFPRFSLRGFLGDISTHAGSIFKPSSATWFAGPGLSIPIFNSKLILQSVEYNKIVVQEAIYNYQKTVLEALEEAENAIGSYRQEEERYYHLDEAEHKYRKTLEYANMLYHDGVKNYFYMIEVEKGLLNAEEAALSSHKDLLLHYIGVYKALGGSFNNQPFFCSPRDLDFTDFERDQIQNF